MGGSRIVAVDGNTGELCVFEVTTGNLLYKITETTEFDYFDDILVHEHDGSIVVIGGIQLSDTLVFLNDDGSIQKTLPMTCDGSSFVALAWLGNSVLCKTFSGGMCCVPGVWYGSPRAEWVAACLLPP